VKLLPKSENQNNIFFETQSLTEWSKQLDFKYLKRTAFFNADQRYFGDVLQKFILYNSEFFRYINVKPYINGNGKHATIGFSSGKYIGAIPLRSPVNGLQIGDFIVKPRFTTKREDLFSYGELISLLGSDISPDFKYSLPLKSKNSVRPPLYIQASKFIQLLHRTLFSTEWVRFQNRLNLIKEPKGEIYWNRYLEKEYDPRQKIIFPCRENYLSQQHKEFFEIVYVYSLARNTILSADTPIQIRILLDQNIGTIDSKLADYKSVETRKLPIHQFDFPIIKDLKEQANNLLSSNLQDVTAWKIDLALLYEKYIQYIFSKVCRELNLHQINNHHIYRSGINLPDWSLKYLEPDIIIKNDRFTMVIDAKYKSHYYNLNQNTEELHEEHRKDLHQILAYSSFIPNINKYLMICYPFSKISIKRLDYGSDMLGTRAKLILLGIPMDAAEVPSIVDQIMGLVHNLE